jgi:hypothetical protein
MLQKDLFAIIVIVRHYLLFFSLDGKEPKDQEL